MGGHQYAVAEGLGQTGQFLQAQQYAGPPPPGMPQYAPPVPMPAQQYAPPAPVQQQYAPPAPVQQQYAPPAPIQTPVTSPPFVVPVSAAAAAAPVTIPGPRRNGKNSGKNNGKNGAKGPKGGVDADNRHGRPSRSVPTVDTLPEEYKTGLPPRPGLMQTWADPKQAWTVARPALSRHALAGVLVLIAFAGGAGVIALWSFETPSMRLQKLADDYIMLAQMTGLIGGYLLLIEVALMARIPWLERRIGSWLATFHRSLGSYLVILLTAHVAFVVLGYSASLNAPALKVVQDVLATYPYVLMATVGYLMIMALGLSSMRAIRRRMSYDRWHSLHLVAYPAVALAYFHQIFMGAQFSHSKVVATIWLAVHLTVLGALVLYRMVLPVRRTLRHRLRVIGVVVESADTVSIYVGGVNIHMLNAQAGQYFRWRFVTRGLWYQSHPFSLSAAPTDDCLRVTIKGVGKYTRRVKRRIRPGVRVIADGPYGAFTSVLRRRQRVLLVGGGVGVTPLRAIAQTIEGGPGDVVFIQRASTVHDLLMVDELQSLEEEGRIRYVPVLGKRGKSPRHDPMSPHKLREVIPDLSEREVFICGSPAMARSAIANLRKAGVRRRNLHSELFDF